jgi:uncharacterized membrane protein YedE/YeeE
MKTHAKFGLFGLLLGVGLSFMGFTDFDEVNKMFRLADPRLLLTFAAGVALTGLAFAVVTRGKTVPLRPVHRGTVAGGLLFGAGWAVTGVCPGVVMVQLGEGKVLAVATLVGIGAGTWLYPRVHRRFFRWDSASCEN